MKVGAMIACAILAAPARAGAEDGQVDWLVGPLVGVAWGGEHGTTSVVGIEGGPGIGPERLNVGIEHRDRRGFMYVELDPWFFVGGSLGLGVDTDGQGQAVVGLWERLPAVWDADVRGRTVEITAAFGYRFTGVHELYLTLKCGRIDFSLGK